MRKLIMFNSITLDGYFTGVNGDLNWAHGGEEDAEYNAFISGNASGEGELIFGRITYEMMIAYWPTPDALKANPEVAEGMNNKSKIVFSRTLNGAAWNNTRQVKGDPVEEVRRMKSEPGNTLVILGSGSIVSLLAAENLIDEYQFIVVPVVLGKGRTLFDGLKPMMFLNLVETRAFNNGKVFLRYEAES